MPKVPPSKLSSRLRKAGVKIKPRKREPVWKGPEIDGITQSLLSRFLVCRERFRLLVVEGLRTAEGFNKSIEYGQMWHTCEEAFYAGESWEKALLKYCQDLARKYRSSQTEINHWYNVCKIQWRVYLDYWKKQRDTLKIKPLLQEYSFSVPYRLGSGRVVRLRGKWDSVDLVTERANRGIWLQENKTKGDLDEQSIQRQLNFDLQTMLYLVALETELMYEDGALNEVLPSGKVPGIVGVRYNCIRRPLSGGRGTIRKHKATKTKAEESDESFYGRLQEIIEGDPDYFFMRWNVSITPGDVSRFRREFLDPALEALCDWWAWISNDPFDPFRANDSGTHGGGLHWRLPYGIYNPIAEGRRMEIDEYLASGSEVGLDRTDNLFPEL